MQTDVLVGADWAWISFDGAKHHAVHKSLFKQLIDDMISRGYPPDEIKALQSTRSGTLTLDQPGMIHVDRPFEDFRIDNLLLEIPCEDVSSFYAQIKTLKVHQFKDGSEYYKLHAWLRCLVLTPEQKQMLEALLWSIEPRAEEKAQKFHEEAMRRLQNRKNQV